MWAGALCVIYILVSDMCVSSYPGSENVDSASCDRNQDAVAYSIHTQGFKQIQIHYSDVYRCCALKQFAYVTGVTLSSIIDRWP